MGFADIRGQSSAVNFLINSLAKDRIACAYLFFGPPGVGKALVARVFAKALNCEGAKLDSCDSCSICKRIDNFLHPDVVWIRQDENGVIKIDQIRQLQATINLRPYEARRKVFVIQDAEGLTEGSCACLLKTLEEPPEDSVLILTSANKQRLPFTILSRCQRVLFRPLSQKDIEEALIFNFNLSQKQARILARLSWGNLERAVQLNQMGLAQDSWGLIKGLLSCKDFEDWRDRQRLLGYLESSLLWLRDVLVKNAGLGPEESLEGQEEGIPFSKERLSFEALQEAIGIVTQSHRLIQQNVNAQFVLRAMKDSLAKLGLSF